MGLWPGGATTELILHKVGWPICAIYHAKKHTRQHLNSISQVKNLYLESRFR